MKGDVAAAILHEIEDQPVCTSPTGQKPTTWISQQVASILSTLSMSVTNNTKHCWQGNSKQSRRKKERRKKKTSYRQLRMF